MSVVHAVVPALLLCAACGGGAAARDAGARGELVVAAPADGYGLGGDAAFALYPLNTTIYEPLVRLSGDYRPEPLLATRWEFVPPNTWRFHLRRGVRFHDGEPFGAEAVRWTMERVARRGSGSTGIAPGSTRVVDDSTVEITPAFSNRRLPEQLVHPVYSIIAPQSEPTSRPVGTGPFRFVEYRPSHHITVSRFDGYWVHVRSCRASAFDSYLIRPRGCSRSGPASRMWSRNSRARFAIRGWSAPPSAATRRCT